MTQLSIFDEIGEPETASIIAKQTDAYFVEYYDIDQKWRLAWIRAKDEDDARYKFSKDKEYKKCTIARIYESDRTYDELEGLEA
jgi:hypothetical protein